ncbi:MAG: LysM peptidoglycan-binding domain-containing protein [Acidimicrobiales bacterium]
MAIAAFPTLPAEDHGPEMPWPRPVLRLVEPPAEEPVAEVVPWGPVTQVVQEPRTGTVVTVRRRARVARQIRRRRAVAGLLVAGALSLLALPVSALAGRPATATPTAAAAHGGVAYVVQPGDTLWSIASRYEQGGDTRALVRELAAETGSTAAVPGERIAVP